MSLVRFKSSYAFSCDFQKKKIKALKGQNIDQKERQENFVLFGLESVS